MSSATRHRAAPLSGAICGMTVDYRPELHRAFCSRTVLELMLELSIVLDVVFTTKEWM